MSDSIFEIQDVIELYKVIPQISKMPPLNFGTTKREMFVYWYSKSDDVQGQPIKEEWNAFISSRNNWNVSSICPV